MRDKEKLANAIKNCIIAVLFVSALLLFYKAVLYESSSELGKISSLFSVKSSVNAAVSPGTKSSELKAEPLFILTTAKDGSHYSIKYNEQSKSDLFSKFSASLEGALGSSGEPNQITSSDWRQVLRGSGVFFDYLYPQPLSYIANCLGTKITGAASSMSARRLYLGESNGKLILYFIDSGSGFFYSCSTALSFSTVSSKIAECPLGTAKFAFESGSEYASLDPYYIFSGEDLKLRGISAVNPLDSNFSVSDLLSLFGINSHTVYHYSEDDGSDVYVEGARTLRIEASGKVFFNVTGNDGVPVSSSGANPSIDDCISACSEIVEKSIGLKSGDASIGLVRGTNTAVSSSSNISFGYFADGIPVSLPDGAYAANFYISGGSITNAELNFRKFTFSGNNIITLPEKQAAAIAVTKSGEPLLIYEDNADGMYSKWVLN